MSNMLNLERFVDTAPDVFLSTVKHHKVIHDGPIQAIKLTECIQSCINGVMELFFNKFRDQAEGGKAVDLTKWTQFLMFDVVGELGFGATFGQLSKEEDRKDVAHWVFLSLVAHAALGWTWFQSLAIFFPPVRWLMNQTI